MICIGHRGAAGSAPQNTRISFTNAIESGCDYIETDVHLCKSGEAVLCHDARIDSTSNGSGEIAELSLTELRSFDFGRGQRIMTLTELLDLCAGKIRLNLELKSEGSGAYTARLLGRQFQANAWKPEDILVTSFNHRELRHFQSAAPQVPTGALIKAVLVDEAAYVDSLGCSVLVSSLEFINAQLVSDLHALGKQVFVYTVNEPEDITRMGRIGVDGIISNFPERVLAIYR